MNLYRLVRIEFFNEQDLLAGKIGDDNAGMRVNVFHQTVF